MEAATIASELEVPGVHLVPAATDIVALHSPPATQVLYEVPSEEHSDSPSVQDPPDELDPVLLPEPELLPEPVGVAGAAAAVLVAAGATEVAKPEGDPVADGAAADDAEPEPEPEPELDPDPELPLSEEPPLLELPSKVTPLAKQLSPVMSAKAGSEAASFSTLSPGTGYCGEEDRTDLQLLMSARL